MPEIPKATTRGRPRSITRERIADAGIKVGLLDISFVNVASALGVSHMALYKRIASIEELKLLIAEEIFSRWQLPTPHTESAEPLKDYLIRFSLSMRDLVKNHAGLSPYLLRRAVTSAPMMEKIHSHQQLIADNYHIAPEQARWLLATIAFHCISVADTLYSVLKQDTGAQTDLAVEESEVEAEFAQGMYALIIGALSMLDGDMPFANYAFQIND